MRGAGEHLFLPSCNVKRALEKEQKGKTKEKLDTLMEKPQLFKEIRISGKEKCELPF